MPKKYVLMLLVFLLATAIVIMAMPGDRQQASPLTDGQSIRAPLSRAACTLAKHDGTATTYFSGISDGTGFFTYFDPAAECAATPTYPFEITAFTFALYDYAGVGSATVDIVVYDIAASGVICDGPGLEKCRTTVTVTTFYPNTVSYSFPTPCCVDGPFFIGIEYPTATAGSTPSVLMDNDPVDTCINWMLYGGAYYEFYDFWNPPVAGDPIFWVDGETQSVACGNICGWDPGDPFKMHFPQLPDEAGWDVNATQPLVLADDFRCEETGAITDIHFWGSWKHGAEGQIVSFVLSLHEDIPADQSPTGYSMPGATLWEREVTEFEATPKDPPTSEGWYDPSTGEVIFYDHQAYFQYDVCFDNPNDWFYQDSGTIYWLNISAIVADPTTTTWGWKSTTDHWNDDGVWATWGNLSWVDLWEPGETLVNGFNITIDPAGAFAQGGGVDFFGEGWYYYPTDWWNIWYYDHPLDYTRRKVGVIDFDIFPVEPGMPSYVEVAVNWATDQWSIDQPPTDSGPPLPGEDEAAYIGRQTLLMTEFLESHYRLPYEILEYNPEWVSVDIRGYNFAIPGGVIEHTCQGSLDLAFVITNTLVQPVDSGACCYDPTGLGINAACMYTTQTYCEQTLGGVYEGNGTQCTAQEACCLPDGSCIMADPLCCTNELGGTPQGVGSQCTQTEACCMPDGSCAMLDPLCCVDQGGTPQGAGSQCTPVQACCMPDGSCAMLDPLCCVDQGGTPQGAGSTCAGTVACCMPDGTCQTVSRVCCDDLGGTPSPFGAPACLGDFNNDGADDACAIREDLKWRQGPDLDETGIDVDASCPGLAVECLVLADDFLCTQTGPITEIHIFGSWYHDQIVSDPGAARFVLSIHDDVPAGADQQWSHPGGTLWMHVFEPGTYSYRPYGQDLVEGYYDPIQQLYEPVGDFTCWEYIFVIPEDSQFIQEGTPGFPVVYWLDLQAYPEAAGAEHFGWKTSLDHWNDDGVWAIGAEPDIPPLMWQELRYPFGHPFELMSMDLAFELYSAGACDCNPGDANADLAINIGDAVYIINYIFKSGPPPTPYALCSGDANCDCAINIADAVYLINYIFKSGPPPCDCLTWLSICGPPLRK